uniref:Si:dkeyp-81f3.4 n=1 Tax=Echeneis naucrates TaxID=173247 RepID=A0A665TPJ4_ECHNA
MEVKGASPNVHFAAESGLLVQSLLDKHRRTMAKDPEDNTPDTDWVASKDFTVEVGKRQIGEYIQTWGVQACWLYSLDFLYTTEEEHHAFYHYRARFSTPTPRAPIQGTASVFFVVCIAKVKPQTLPVEVRFVLEANRLVHTPGKTRFTEKWLAEVIESKAGLRNAVDF